MRISDWSSDMCSSDLLEEHHVDDDEQAEGDTLPAEQVGPGDLLDDVEDEGADHRPPQGALAAQQRHDHHENAEGEGREGGLQRLHEAGDVAEDRPRDAEEEGGDGPGDQLVARSEEHTSELPSLMRKSYAVFCLKQT